MTASAKLSQHLENTEQYLLKQSLADLEHKPQPNKWSKKEILGHLIDSGINNLQRFTEIKFADRPYIMRPYSQDDLVKANNYQQADIQELINVWKALNHRIAQVINTYTDEMLNYELAVTDELSVDLKYWIQDYVEHMEHHLEQITK